MLPVFAVSVGIRTVVLERCQVSGGDLEARSEGRLGACLVSELFLRHSPHFSTTLFFFFLGSSGFTGLEIPSWFMASAFHLSPGKSLAV